MDKKTFFITAATVAVIVVVVLVALRQNGLRQNSDEQYDVSSGLLAEPILQDGTTYLVPPGDIYDTGVTAADIPALTNPLFTDVGSMDRLLGDDLLGIDVQVNGIHRFYSYQILNWHHVVNDTFGDKALLVIYDPLSGTAAVYESTASLASTGKVYNNTQLLTEGSGSLWLATRGMAVAGPRAGEALVAYPSQSMAWKTWKDRYPDGEVLSSETGYERDYTRHPYGAYEETTTVYFPLNTLDDRLKPKTRIEGVVIGDEQLAVVGTLLTAIDGVLNDQVGGTAIVALYDEDAEITNVFDATVDGQRLTFTYNAGEEAIMDTETGSTWSVDGECIDGPMRGTRLTLINAPEYYWFAWAAAYPQTRVNPDETVLATTNSDE